MVSARLIPGMVAFWLMLSSFIQFGQKSCGKKEKSWRRSDRSTDNPVGLTEIDLLSQPMAMGGLQLIIRNITLFGQWPAPLGNGILG
jgi:hypothetical protein